MSDPRSLGPVQEDDPNEQTYRANLGQRGTPGYPATPGQSGAPGFPATPGQTPAPAPSPAFPGSGTSGNTGVVGPLQSPAGLAQRNAAPPPQSPAGVGQGNAAPTPPPWIQNDYWAPDRAQVLADPSRWGPGPNGEAPPSAPAPTSPGGYDRQRFVNEYMNSGVKNGAEQLAWINAHPEFATGVRQTNGKNGTIVLPDGSVLDAGEAFSTGNGRPGWMGIGTMGANGQFTPAAMGTGGAGGFGSGAGGGDFQNQIRQKLLDILGKAQTPVDENSAEVAQPFQAAQLQAQRGADAERKALAERLYAAGGGNVNGNELQQGMQQSAERMAVGLGGIKSQLIGRAVQAKQAQLQQALSLAVQSGDAEAARAIQMQIAEMQNQYNYAQLAQQQGIWNDQYGLDKAKYEQNQNSNTVGGLT